MSRMNLNVVELSERDEKTSFKSAVHKSLGDISKFKFLGSNVLVATYIQPSKTKGGILLPHVSVEEDRWQGKVGLVLMMGEMAFKFDGPYQYTGSVPKPGDYVLYRAVDAVHEVGIRGVSCRTIDSSLIRAIVPDPDDFY